MAFPRSHHVLQVFGVTRSDAEDDIWTFRLRIVPPADDIGAITETERPGVMTDIAGDLTTWWTAIAGRFDNNTSLRGFKFNRVGTDGKYRDAEKTHVRDLGTPGTGLLGTNQAGPLPPQVAVAVTLRTDAVRGLAHVGRIYLPTPGAATLDVEGRLAVAARDNFATATAQLLTNLNNWPGFDAALDPGVVSIGSNIGAGAFRPVTGVQVGNVYDTQRRRRNRYTERFSAKSSVQV